jgi:hypothetical protein
MHQHDDAGNGKRKGRAKDGPSSVGVRIFLGFSLESVVIQLG